jgi:hypothetical protein
MRPNRSEPVTKPPGSASNRAEQLTGLAVLGAHKRRHSSITYQMVRMITLLRGTVWCG